MNLQGVIVDNSTGKGIPFATIEILTANSASTGTSTIADTNGNFTLNSPLLDDQSNQVKVSSVGYGTQIQPIDNLVNYGGIGLDQAPTNLPAVTVTAKAPASSSSSSSMLPLLLAGGAAFIIFKMAGGKKKVGAVDSKTLLIAGAVGVGGYLLYKTFVKPATVTTPVTTPVLATQAAYSIPGSSVATDISAAGTAASGILNAISNF